MLASPLNFWKHCPRDNSQKLFGGIRSCLAVRLWLCKRLCLPFPVLVMLIFKIFLVQMVYVVIMAFATQIVGANIVRPSFSLCFWKHYPRDNFQKPFGGIRSLPSLSALGLQTPLFAFSCTCNVDFQDISCADGLCCYYGVCHAKGLLF